LYIITLLRQGNFYGIAIRFMKYGEVIGWIRCNAHRLQKKKT